MKTISAEEDRQAPLSVRSQLSGRAAPLRRPEPSPGSWSISLAASRRSSTPAGRWEPDTGRPWEDAGSGRGSRTAWSGSPLRGVSQSRRPSTQGTCGAVKAFAELLEGAIWFGDGIEIFQAEDWEQRQGRLRGGRMRIEEVEAGLRGGVAVGDKAEGVILR